jgi:hypothetical protein
MVVAGHVAKNSINFGRVNFYGKQPSRDDPGNEYGKSFFTQIDTNERNVFHDSSPNESLSSA